MGNNIVFVSFCMWQFCKVTSNFVHLIQSNHSTRMDRVTKCERSIAARTKVHCSDSSKVDIKSCVEMKMRCVFFFIWKMSGNQVESHTKTGLKHPLTSFAFYYTSHIIINDVLLAPHQGKHYLNVKWFLSFVFFLLIFTRTAKEFYFGEKKEFIAQKNMVCDHKR